MADPVFRRDRNHVLPIYISANRTKPELILEGALPVRQIGQPLKILAGKSGPHSRRQRPKGL
jgi:hypothetical protein